MAQELNEIPAPNVMVYFHYFHYCPFVKDSKDDAENGKFQHKKSGGFFVLLLSLFSIFFKMSSLSRQCHPLTQGRTGETRINSVLPRPGTYLGQ